MGEQRLVMRRQRSGEIRSPCLNAAGFLLIAPRAGGNEEIFLTERMTRAGSIERLGQFVTYCGLADEICHVFLATDLTPGEQKLDKSEDITVHTVSSPELLEMISDGKFCDGMGLAALHLARARLPDRGRHRAEAELVIARAHPRRRRYTSPRR